jgi:DNA primase
MADFQLAYLMKNGYDNFSQQLSNQILTIDSTNINALMANSNYTTYIFRNLLQKANFPPNEKFAEYPELQAAYNKMIALQQKLTERGYQDMPAQQYKDWLKSIELEKQKQRYREEQERMKREIEQLKKIKSTFTNTPKD